MKKVVSVFVLVAVAAGVFFAGRRCHPHDAGRTASRVDTVWVRDTVRDTVLVPVERFVVRVDTVWVGTPTADLGNVVAPDSVQVALAVERAVYSTADYRAVVEGFRPSLVEMEIYRNTARITKETTRTLAPGRWSAGLQAGWGITPRGFAPYLGVGIQYRLTTH